jgi:hypothetical protein
VVRGVDALATADAIAKMSWVVAQAGARDILEGNSMVATSRDIASQSEAVGALSDEDLNLVWRWRVAEQLRAMTGVVNNLGPAVIAGSWMPAASDSRLAETMMARAGAALWQKSSRNQYDGSGLVRSKWPKVSRVRRRPAACRKARACRRGLGLMVLGMAEAEARDLQEAASEMAAGSAAEST